MLEAMEEKVELGGRPNIWRNMLALFSVSAINGMVKPPLSTPFAYSSGSVMLVRTYCEPFLVTTSE